MDNEVKSELYLGEVPQAVLQWAQKEIREDPSTTCQSIEEFRDLIYSRGECTPIRTDDRFLLRFLRARHFYVKSAYKLFVNYHMLREEHPEFFEGVNFDLLDKIGKHDVINVPPYREQTGRRMLLYRIGNWDPNLCTINEVLQATLLILELAILEEQAQILGGIALFDLNELSMQQAWFMTPAIAHSVIKIMITSFYMKIESVHIVNNSWIFDTLFQFFKPFLSERHTSRIFFHGTDMESLHKHVDPKWLPQRYGGMHPDYSYSDWTKGFRANKQIINELSQLGYKLE